MKPFAFLGKLPASKSMLNRLLLVQSYFPDFQIRGTSLAADVVHMRAALSGLHDGSTIDCGSAGTVLRFMALRASRQPGEPGGALAMVQLVAIREPELAGVSGWVATAALRGLDRLRQWNRERSRTAGAAKQRYTRDTVRLEELAATDGKGAGPGNNAPSPRSSARHVKGSGVFFRPPEFDSH